MTPEPPLLSGEVGEDVTNLWYYIMEVAASVDAQPDGGWSTSGTTPLRTVSGGMSLTDLTNVVATLVAMLTERGVLSAEAP